MNEMEIELSIRVSMYGEYENTIGGYADEGSSHDEIMAAAKEAVYADYGYYDEWDEGEISWTVDY
jgi:hypothetical protein